MSVSHPAVHGVSRLRAKLFPAHNMNRHQATLAGAIGRALPKKYALQHGGDACVPETFTSHKNIHRCQKCLRWWTTPAVRT